MLLGQDESKNRLTRMRTGLLGKDERKKNRSRTRESASSFPSETNDESQEYVDSRAMRIDFSPNLF